MAAGRRNEERAMVWPIAPGSKVLGPGRTARRSYHSDFGTSIYSMCDSGPAPPVTGRAENTMRHDATGGGLGRNSLLWAACPGVPRGRLAPSHRTSGPAAAAYVAVWPESRSRRSPAAMSRVSVPLGTSAQLCGSSSSSFTAFPAASRDFDFSELGGKFSTELPCRTFPPFCCPAF